MLIETLDRGLIIHTPAKINLFLEVLGKRADGYHEIDSIICPVTLFDRLRFEANDSGRIEFFISAGRAQRCRSEPLESTPIDHASFDSAPWSGTPLSSAALGGGGSDDRAAEVGLSDGVALNSHGNSHGGDSTGGARCGRAAAGDAAWNIPEDGSNLVVRALEALRSELGSRAGCRVELEKNIPAAAGLGGGSSDAAAAIVAGLALWSQWDRQLALRVGARLGSDIPLFFGDERNGIGLAWVTGRGERIEMLSGRPPLHFVISHPPVGSSTAEVYKLWRSNSGHRSSEGMLAACSHGAAGDVDGLNRIEKWLFNALQFPASQLTDWIDRQLACFARLGKPSALMSGSGSACFSLVGSPDEGQEIVEELIAFGLPRAYAAQAWYAPSIEQQLERILENTSL